VVLLRYERLKDWEQTMKKVDLQEKFALFNEQWQPKVVGELNGQYVKLAKLQGEFIWHRHENEDEMFMVIKGRLTIRLREEDVHLEEGQFFIIPKGVDHLPVAEEEVHVMLFEPKTVINTGDQRNERTIEQPETI
jgi:mannose-6-phosphate isomerase-like protein (cupin superfamily)